MSRFLRTSRKATSSTSATPGPTPRPTQASSTAFRCRKCGYSSLSRFVQDEVELRPVCRRVSLALALSPARAVVLGKRHIPFVVAMDLGQHEPGCARQRLGKQLLATDDERDALASTQRQCGVERAGHGGSGRFVARGARHDDVVASRERLAIQRFPRFSSHDHGMAERQALEVLKVLREMPRQATLATDDAIGGHRGDEIDLGAIWLRHLQTILLKL